VDLEPERKADILLRERQLETQNHYEVLGLQPGASDEEEKAAYYELSRQFHPDRFFQKNLGSFRGRIERIFRRVKEAHEVLSDPDARAAYLKANPRLTPRTSAAPERPARTAVDDARDAERRARLARHPYLSRTRQATQLMSKSKQAMTSGEYASAYSALHKLNQLRPEMGGVSELLEESRKKHGTTRAREELQAGNRARADGKYEEAIRGYRMAHTLDPTLSTAVWRLAELLLERKETEEALRFAEQAVKLEPNRADYQVILGEVLLAQDHKKAARQHFEEALRLSPDHEGAKKGLKKTRWLF
jgi:curved DNA-binding protein CbpA